MGLFANVDAEKTIFGYVLNVENGREFPKIEGVLNSTAVKNLDDIIDLGRKPGFIPNVRTCKFIAAQGSEQIERFCDSVPPEVAEKPTNITKILAKVRYFLQHLDELLVKQIDPVKKAQLFGALFDRLPTYEEIKPGTPKTPLFTGVSFSC